MHDLLLMRNSAVSGNSEDKTLYIKVLLFGTQDYTSMHTVSTKDIQAKRKKVKNMLQQRLYVSL